MTAVNNDDAEELEPMTDAEYVAVGVGVCPFCRSDQIEGDSVDIHDRYATQEVSCSACGKTWDDRYKLIGYDSREEE